MATPERINHLEKGLNEQIDFFRKKPIARGILGAYLKECDRLEDLLFQILLSRGIFEAEGVQLENIGELFGESRDGDLDPLYRSRILRRIAIQRSDGTTEVFLQGMRTITGSSFVDFFEHYSAHVAVWLGNGYGPGIRDSLNQIKPVGVSLDVIIDEDFDSLVMSEGITTNQDLQTHLGEDIQVIDNFGILRDLQVTVEDLSGSVNEKAVMQEEILSNTLPGFLGELNPNRLFNPMGELLVDDSEVINIDNLLSPNNPDLFAFYEFEDPTEAPLIRDSSPNQKDIVIPSTWEFFEGSNSQFSVGPDETLEGTIIIPDTIGVFGGSQPFTVSFDMEFRASDRSSFSSQSILGCLSPEGTPIGLVGGWDIITFPTINVTTGEEYQFIVLEGITTEIEEASSFTFPVPWGEPINITLTWDGTEVAFYINGLLVAAPGELLLGNGTIEPNTEQPLQIAIAEDTILRQLRGGFPGSMDNLRLFTRALLDVEVRALTPYDTPIIDYGLVT